MKCVTGCDTELGSWPSTGLGWPLVGALCPQELGPPGWAAEWPCAGFLFRRHLIMQGLRI